MVGTMREAGEALRQAVSRCWRTVEDSGSVWRPLELVSHEEELPEPTRSVTPVLLPGFDGVVVVQEWRQPEGEPELLQAGAPYGCP